MSFGGGGGYSDTDFGAVTLFPLRRHHFKILHQGTDTFTFILSPHLVLIADQSHAVFLMTDS